MRLVKLTLFTLVLAVVFAVLIYALNDESSEMNSAMLNERVPSFNLTSLDSTSSDLTKEILIGNDYKLLNVWASWCGVCKQEHVFLNQLNAQGIAIYGLNYRDIKKNAIKVLEKDGNPYINVIFDPKGELALDLGVIGTPETFLIDNNGVIIRRVSGVINQPVWDQMFAPFFGS